MKNTSLFGLTAATFLLIAIPTIAHQKPAPKMNMGDKMPEQCKMMMMMHQKMETSTKNEDVKLKELMATSDRASGDGKIKAMTAVIDELVAQRSSRQTMMDQMHSQMMAHMMKHMQSGDKASMMQCPMMSGMGMMGKGGMTGHDMTKMKAK